MGRIDILTNDYVGKREVFADIFNKYLYGGRQVIKPDDLRPLDTAEYAVPFGKDGKGVPVQRFRDVLKSAAYTDGKMVYCVLGVENQDKIHYAMPVKNGLYDFLELASQVTEKTAENKRKWKIKDEADGKTASKISKDEFLSGLLKTDRLIPVVTIVIYWGSEEWDAPLNLREMYRTDNEKILSYAPDYHVNLIAPRNMSEEEIDEFHTSMREVMRYIKHSDDMDKLSEIMEKDDRFRNMERQVADLINNVTNSKLEYPEGEETVDMCKAIFDMRKASKEEGKAEGERIGEARGKAEGEKIGEARGKLLGKVSGIIGAFKNLGADKGKLCQYLAAECEISSDEAEKYIEMYW